MSTSAGSGRVVVVVCWMGLQVWGASGLPAVAAAAQSADACATSQGCRDAALTAETAREFERFHDLAWRAAQLGPKDEPDLMYLLARAQVTSGRPSDALVMLRRLAQLGVATDADELEEFRRVRDRSGWSEVETMARSAARRVTRDGSAVLADASRMDALSEVPATGSAASGAPARTAGDAPAVTTPPATPAVAPTGARVLPPLHSDADMRLDALAVATGGFAYDAVSGRFLVGSVSERKIVVVDEPSRRASDLVRGDSARFRTMAAMRIDTRRGDLWVISNDAGKATLHKLQLIAGRPLASLEAPAAAGPVRFSDLSVTPSGSVLVVDAEGRRIFRAAPRATALEQVATINLITPVAIASASNDHVVYVAHADGIARLDLASAAVVPVRSSSDVPLDAVQRVWWHDGALVVLRTLTSGAQRLQRVALDRRGTAVVSVQAIDVALPDASLALAVTVAGHDLFVMTAEPASGEGSNGSPVQAVVRRVRLRP